MRKFYSLHEIYKRNLLYWMKTNTHKRFLKYLHEYDDILQPITKGNGVGLRYYVWEDNLENFIRLYENGELPKR